MADLSAATHNERLKLTATWINGMAVAFFAVGGLAPLFTMLYGDRPASLQLVFSAMSCILAAPALHYWARFSLKDLR
ncbi:amino acid transporter [Brucella endophytica]|uniref:amino acid transporter n=1 Tax=Brucella endophytica TaxID=1963359 RepID=UPI001669F17B|nr:amino acid transporter [Brucella endophytica]